MVRMVQVEGEPLVPWNPAWLSKHGEFEDQGFPDRFIVHLTEDLQDLQGKMIGNGYYE